MAKAGAERQKERILKLKFSGKYEDFKKKRSEQRRLQRLRKKQNETRDEEITRLASQRIQVAKSRVKNKGVKGPIRKTNQVTPTFKNKQSFSKAYNKVKNALPLDLDKAICIIEKLCKEYEVNQTIKQKSPSNIKIFVENFFLSDRISVQAPGIRDFYIKRNEDGTKTKIQKKFLTMTLREACTQFLEDFPNAAMSFSTLVQHRPEHVFLRHNTPKNLCLCIYHENINLILGAVHKFFTNSIQDFIQSITCDPTNKNCMLQTCDRVVI